jgi:hypothetical protein
MEYQNEIEKYSISDKARLFKKRKTRQIMKNLEGVAFVFS